MKIETWRELSLAYLEANKNNKGIDVIGTKKYVSVDSLIEHIKSKQELSEVLDGKYNSPEKLWILPCKRLLNELEGDGKTIIGCRDSENQDGRG